MDLFNIRKKERGKQSNGLNNLSFSFNLDFENMKTDDSSDSESTELQIDISEVDNCEPPTRHKRDTMDEITVLNEMEEEIERQLDAKAAKTNLTATNVKNILKHVITNEHVMAMVQKRLHNSDDDIIFEPKLTRAKAKELAMTQPDIPWPMTPVKKTAPSEVQVLIEEELSEDSSDEEYNPDQDQQSDDEREAETSVGSDAESQPSTPATSMGQSTSSEQLKVSDTRYDSDGIFKIPSIPLVPTEEESIGQRTRSKLCLSETPLEHIEQAFVPPDITTDMYDWDCDNDEDWDNFLKEFTQPLAQEPVAEDDPDADPEYNILEDEETELLDKEELRMDRAVKVTRRELNNLVAELFEFADMFSKEEQEIPRKKKNSDTLVSSMESTSMNNSMVDLLPALAERELPKLVNVEQRFLLATQFRQHVQLMTQHFAMTYMHPEFHSQSTTCKQNLHSIRYLSNGSNSAFNVENLPDALALVAAWEKKFLDPKFKAEYIDMIEDEDGIGKVYANYSCKYIPKFHPELEKLLMECKALIYPQLLPEMPPRCNLHKCVRLAYLKSEENLIALGLEQFLPFVASKNSKFKTNTTQLRDAVHLIMQYLLPTREMNGILFQIKKCRSSAQENPIKYYYETGSAPRTVHYITRDCQLRAPKDQSLQCLSRKWQDCLNGVKQDECSTRYKKYAGLYRDLKEERNYAANRLDPIRIDRNLRNPIVNMLSNTVSLKKNRIVNNSGKKNVAENVQKQEPSDTKESTINQNSVTAMKCLKNDMKFETCHSSVESLSSNCNKIYQKKDNVTTTEVERKTIGSKSDEPIDVTRIPQLRKTTARLAKIQNAQNTKMTAPIPNSKDLSLTCSPLRSSDKCGSPKDIEESSTSSKGDNEDEIAELMLASTTIKKDTASRRKAKQARELENIKRLLEAESDLSQEDKATKFAASYFQKLHLTLESTNPDTFKAVIKTYLDYNDKLDAINQVDIEEFPHDESDALGKDSKRVNSSVIKDKLAIDLYKEICEKLVGYPEMCTDCLLFLTPHQAALIDKSVEHLMLQKMSEFVNVAQIYFAKQPSRLAKVMQAITQLASDPYVTLEKAYAVMGPVLKGHPLVMDMFLQVLPNGKPPESLFASHLFENLTCPLGPHDKNKVYTEDAPELYETVEMSAPTSQDDPYGGENCKCECHTLDNPSLKIGNEHCVSCGTRFLNGRIYLQTSEGLRPAKVTFPGDDEERLENIARVSMKTTERILPVSSTRRRRKSLKNETSLEDSKQLTLKHSPTKDSDDGDRSIPRSRKGAKSPPKACEQRKSTKTTDTTDQSKNSSITANKKISSPIKVKREKRIEKRETRVEAVSGASCEVRYSDHPQVNEDTSKALDNDEKDVGQLRESMNYDSPLTEPDETEGNVSLEKMDISCDSDNAEFLEIQSETLVRPWTRQEDMILLQSIQREYSDDTFLEVTKMLENRTIKQVKERAETLLSLLEKAM
ncbi:GON-4-like protein isoform X2 [Orussus abietinus]|uniref:GON-4-like protein isoform X2 n=1 Tax=Orussus abietinus TaxID=222816 RepID=UPI0006262035|nr:GON-4-like protein isoform X2 [Orussus abietinus]